MKAKIYTKPSCPFCKKTKTLLSERNIEFEDIDVSLDPALRAEISASVGNYRTVPMIFLDGEFIGGHSELSALDESGKLA